MLSPDLDQQLRKLNERFVNAQAGEILSYFVNQYGKELAFATSLGAEDQVLTYLLSQINKDVKIFTLDTGRLFPETIDLIDKTNKRYDINISVYFPDYEQLEEMVNNKGINLFYESIKNRKECCHIRKIIPMKRALKGTKAWISGLRSEQSVTRQGLTVVSWDENFGLVKINPLTDWTETQLWDFIKAHDIPYNELHDKGYPSIGCQPCTRAISPGDDIRGGRWWWEQAEHKECGLHENNR
ncbi:MAG: phosphoadenylyl-sulfate reductase [Bacteroidales bacterium]|nr:phosphoadenylyl-sulfate reductase [Bacteroidales bacterium]